MKKIVIVLLVSTVLGACNGDVGLFKKAKLAESKGQIAKAVQLYSKIIKKYPSHSAAFVNRGLAFEKMPVKDVAEKNKNRAFAEKDYLRAIEINPNVVEAYGNLGALYIDEGKDGVAVYYLSEAIARNPQYYTALTNRAVAYTKLGRIASALADFNSALKLRDNDEQLFLNRASTYYGVGQYSSALEDISYAIHLNPEDARAYLERAKVLSKMGYPSNAYEDLEQAIALKPNYALAYYYMGDLLFRKGEKDQALGMLVRAKELAPKYVPTYELMGDMLAMEDPVSAVANYNVALQLDPANARRYEAKRRAMRTDAGREKVISNRFFPR